jgi:V/A-type H+/Na+-transporting ATPase subunit K
MRTKIWIACALLLWSAPALAAAEPSASAAVDPSMLHWGFIMAGVATAISSIAAAFAVARVGSAAVGALAEKPELFGRVVVLVGLAEGIAIYGLIISILILNRL